MTARSHPKLLGFKATLSKDGEVLVDGVHWTDDEVSQRVSEALGQKVTLFRHQGPERFDILPLLVATDGAIEHMKMDGRRLRPNLVIGDVKGLAERTWPERKLQVGTTIVAPMQLRGRCVMTTYEPDTLKQDINVLRKIVNQLDGVMGLDTDVVLPGPLKIGDLATLLK
ncbi:MAG: MOSC domain-containing protein [Acidobacteria bacterium]|nr:MOSC domain-containing protein [Acidobacteriota bacterium]